MPGIDISIIIPTYNRLWCLPEAVESCRNNDCSVEIIVVDDGSTDGTAEWLLTQLDVIVLSQPHIGKCWAVNKAFNIAKGKYIRFLDSDDAIEKNANDRQFKLAEINKADIVVSGYKSFDSNGKILSEQRWIVCDDFVAQQLGECDSSHYSAYLFKKRIYQRHSAQARFCIKGRPPVCAGSSIESTCSCYRYGNRIFASYQS